MSSDNHTITQEYLYNLATAAQSAAKLATLQQAEEFYAECAASINMELLTRATKGHYSCLLSLPNHLWSKYYRVSMEDMLDLLKSKYPTLTFNCKLDSFGEELNEVAWFPKE